MTTAPVEQGVEMPRGRDEPPVPVHLWCFLAAVVALLVNKNSQYLHLPISPDRLLFPVAILLLFLDANRPRLRWSGVHTLMVVLVLWTVGSMAWHGNLMDNVSLFALSDRMTMPLVLFVVAPLFFDTPGRRDLLLKTVTLIGVYLGIEGIVEMLAPAWAFPPYVADPSVGTMYGRARGPFLAADAMGLSCTICAFAAVTLLVRRPHLWWRVAAMVTVVTGTASTALSLTRATWFGAGAGLLVGALLAPRLRTAIPVVAGALAAGAVAVSVALPELTERFASRWGEVGAVNDRLGSNDAALSLLQDLPWTGIGWQRFFPYGSEWFRLSDAYPMNNVVVEIHNVLLARAVELGVPAAAVLLCIWAWGPGRVVFLRLHGDLAAWRILALAVFTAWVVTGMANPMAVPFPNFLAWLIAGVPTASWAVSPRDDQSITDGEADPSLPG
ncbi:O-antigen ligase [Austwickia sp. TVS 96-490-7B]|uniref:O-antigen ligase family protein n=1 Tax=Austwickia sp. TVS 96-490-7B TaxID=2830843 RepID=UPI001C5685F3|nr:O-antigen ligase family protein [Austwickia sp. TVS 96-490-7B]